MKKRILLLAVAMILTVTACGGEKEPAAPTTTAAETTTEESTTEKETEPETTETAAETKAVTGTTTKKQDREAEYESFADAEAYMGLTEDGGGVYYAGSLDGEIALLMFLDANAEQHYVFVGPVTFNNNGTATITDSEDGLTLTFGIEAYEEGIIIDMGPELGKAVMGNASVQEVIDLMVEIEAGTTAVGSGSAQATGNESLSDIIVEAYVGLFEDETSVYIAGNDDGSLMVVVLLSPDMTESIAIVGSAEANGNYIKVTDYDTGRMLGFELYTENDMLILDMGDFGKAVVVEADKNEVLAAMQTIGAETNVNR